MPRRIRFAVAALLAGGLGNAAAEESNLGRETEVLDPGECEVEVGFERETRRRAPRKYETAVQFGCGIGGQTEVELTFAREHAAGEREHALELEARTLIVEAGDGAAWSIAYGVAGEREHRGRWRHASQFAALEWTRPFAEAWLFEARVGARRDVASRRDRTFWAFALERQLGDETELRIEGEADNRSRPEYAVALRLGGWSEDAFWTLRYGWARAASRARSIGVSLTVDF